MPKTEEEILNGSPFTVTLNGVSYEWKQKPRAQQRKIRSELSQLMPLMVGFDTAGDIEQASRSIDLVNAVLDFCERNNEAMESDGDSIEAYLREAGIDGMTSVINDVFMPIFKEWLEPYMGVPSKKGAGKKPRQNLKSTK
jgi:hypothetical protein